ncbi:MAG: sodium:alanine symporter family protein, partial [Lachnospiraceae bacterium]|nr:sodium:alanine symporter family protein [Lachnospiraceae bacterium]
MEVFMNTKVIGDVLSAIDDVVWGPIMLILLVGTGIFLTVRTRALCIRNLPYAIRSVLSKEARQKKGEGDVSPFSALTTALAATIGTGNIVGVATAMVSGGPGALVWMWISAVFGLTSKFSECMLAIKYREVNEKGEMSGGPMYTMRKAFNHKKIGALFGWFFALFAVIASFGIGNLTQANSISTALFSTFKVPLAVTGAIITLLALFIIIGGIKSISKVSQVVVPLMAVFYIVAGLIVILGNIKNVPAGIVMIFKMAFSIKSVGGGLCGALVASMGKAIRFGVARGIFSNEAGMGSAAITAAAASTTNHVRQGYINMTGTFWDTIVVCTITGICIASSGVLGSTQVAETGSYTFKSDKVIEISATDSDKKTTTKEYDMSYEYQVTDEDVAFSLTEKSGDKNTIILYPVNEDAVSVMEEEPEHPEQAYLTAVGEFTDGDGNHYTFHDSDRS